VALNPALPFFNMLVFVSLLAMLGTSQHLAFVPQINTVLLLGAPMVPTWWIKISIHLQWERFLSVIFYNLVLKIFIIFKALVLNPHVHMLCSSQLLRFSCISFHFYFCLFTSSKLMCFLSPMLGIIMIFVVFFVKARTLRSNF
jgi:hypothetical protein